MIKQLLYKVKFLRIIAVSYIISIQAVSFAQFSDLAPTPPMGWNSWNAFGLEINSKIVKSVADSFTTKGLKAAGYEYIVIDDGWQIGRDKNGKIIADSTRFPEGIKYIADYVHSKGLKFGIYTCCGTKTCGGRPGSYGYEEIDAKTYAEWGVDFIKEDWCFTDGLTTRAQYKKMSEAIKKTGRHMLLSLCEWGTSSPWEWANGVSAMWRTTNDIQDCFDCVRSWGGMGWVKIMDKNAGLAPYAGPGHWNDPDMLEVGNQALNPTECKSHFVMWCMMASPLIAGNNISTMNNTIRDILTAPEIIAIDQDPLGVQGIRVRNENGLQVWEKPLKDGSIAVALLNVTAAPANMYATLEEIGLKKGVTSTVRDLWNRKNLPSIKDTFKTQVASHDVVVIKIKGEKAQVSSLKFNKASVELNKGNHGTIDVTVIPSITPVMVNSSDEKIASLAISGVNSYKITAKNEGTCVLKASTTDGKMVATTNVKITPSSLPAPWKFDDINEDIGSVTSNNKVISIEGGGNDIWGGMDQFAFVNRKIENASGIICRILSQTNSDPWAKSGLMLRESTAANSRFVMICTTPANGLSLQWRDSTGGSCSKKDFKAVQLPMYFKLVNNGSTFTAYKSADKENWEKLGEVTLKKAFEKECLVGMAVASHSSHALSIAKFDEIDLVKIDKK